MWCTRLAGKARPKKSPKIGHLGTIAQLCQAISSQQRHISTIGKNLWNSNTSSTCPHNMVNFSPLAAEICWRVWGTPANFNGFRVLAALLHSTPVVGVSQTLRHWTEGATYIWQGGHHVGHWPTFLVVSSFALCGRLSNVDIRLLYYFWTVRLWPVPINTLYIMHFPAILSNDNGMTAYICRRFISTTAFVVMAALWNRAGHYIFALWFLLPSSSFFFPCLISAVTDWMYTTLPHMVWP